ncbi:syntaxin-1B-like [Topomyia yanbarensis]|uniref:syntaxin-1B-like n=1 Tax=Topomyia yanbarensis TaxID=2498891 RepID=UPI00273B0830|nr:syntaxin-1B-like [Topomyia yanbarensis]
MTRDRLSELLEKSTFKDFEYKFVQEHEFWTIYNQERILDDLDRFSEISTWIRELQRNILDIEVNIFSEGFDKAGRKMKENATLCYKIYSAVKRMQNELTTQQWREQEEVVSRVRSVQYDSIKAAYLKAYWHYEALVGRLEETIKLNSCILSSRESLYQSDCGPADRLLQETQYRRLSQPCSTDDTINDALSSLGAVEDRHHELRALERSLVEMRDLFVLFSTLVMQHGSLLNLIEGNVQTASDHVVSAVEKLETAREYQWKATGRNCLCFNRIAILLFILAVLTVIVFILIIKKFLL